MWDVIHGDCLDVMRGIEPESVDAVVTDPPYGLSFMGKDWDHGLPGVHFWEAAYGVLKPSSYLLAFGGTRTWHRLACAIEDAGFEIRDTLMWLYGSGFPKGKSCLKPAWEPIILARKPGPMRELGIEECRIGIDPDDKWARGVTFRNSSQFAPGSPPTRGDVTSACSPSGRWPANLILDEEAGKGLDEQTGPLPAGVAVRHRSGGKTFGTDKDKPPLADMSYSDSGGPSRFFYCAKASRRERNAGLEGMEERECCADGLSRDMNAANSGLPVPRAHNHHPTVKPVALMSWLVKLVANPGDLVLDPFLGSGTTGIAAVTTGRSFVGIEREAEYAEIARRRIGHHACSPPETATSAATSQIEKSDSDLQIALF